MTERIDYTKIAEKVNYPALEKKLDELRHQPPPKKRKGAAQVLAPLTGKLLELRAKGWSYRQLVDELKNNGLTVTLTALRDHLVQAEKKRKHAEKKTA